MEKNTESNVTDSVSEQKKIPQKRKCRALWWLLLVLIIIVLALWFSTHRNGMTDKVSSTTVAGQTEAPSSSQEADDSPSAQVADKSQSALTRLQDYYQHSADSDSSWININEVNFATGSATPQVSDTRALERIAALIARHPDHEIVIHGFTDSTGNFGINQALSGQRADALKQWLVQHNIAAEQIKTEAKGDSMAVAPNHTAVGRDQNRRVAIQVKAAKSSS